MNAVSGWTIIVEVPKHAAEVFDRALAPLSAATSSFRCQIRIFGASKRLPSARRMKRRWLVLSRSRGLSDIPEPDIRVAPLPAIDWVASKNLFNRFPLAGSLFIPHYDGIVPAGSTSLAVDAGPLSERDRTAPPLAASCAGRTITKPTLGSHFRSRLRHGYSCTCYRETLAPEGSGGGYRS